MAATQDYVAERRDPEMVGKTAQEVRTPQGCAQDYVAARRDPEMVGKTAQEKSPAWLRLRITSLRAVILRWSAKQPKK